MQSVLTFSVFLSIAVHIENTLAGKAVALCMPVVLESGILQI
jgi:hypothetical protein